MKLGIIAGQGQLPQLLAQKALALGYEPVVALLDANDSAAFALFHSQNFNIGQIGKIIEFFKANGVKQIALVGKVHRPNWQQLKVDSLGGLLLARIMKNKLFGDDALMQVIDSFIQEQGFEVIPFLDILSSMRNQHNQTKAQPDEQDLLDIKLGAEVAKVIGQFDIGQAVIVERGCVLGVEGQEGTDLLLARCTSLVRFAKPSGVLVKVAKPSQSLRLDPPGIGSATIEAVYHCGLRGVAYQRNKTAIIDEEATFAAADKLGIYIYELKE